MQNNIIMESKPTNSKTFSVRLNFNEINNFGGEPCSNEEEVEKAQNLKLDQSRESMNNYNGTVRKLLDTIIYKCEERHFPKAE